MTGKPTPEGAVPAPESLPQTTVPEPAAQAPEPSPPPTSPSSVGRSGQVPPRRTVAGAVYLFVVVSVVLLILLIDFIAQNGHKVGIHFFTASGHVSQAVALLVAAVVGAVIVAIPSLVRIAQLRKEVRRRHPV